MSEAKCAFQGFDSSGHLPDPTQKPCGKPAAGKSCHYGGDTPTCGEHHCGCFRAELQRLSDAADYLLMILARNELPHSAMTILTVALGRAMSASIEADEPFADRFAALNIYRSIESSYAHHRELCARTVEDPLIEVVDGKLRIVDRSQPGGN